MNFRFVLGLILMRKRRIVYESTRQDEAGEIWSVRFKGKEELMDLVNPRLDEQQVGEVSSQLGEILNGDSCRQIAMLAAAAMALGSCACHVSPPAAGAGVFRRYPLTLQQLIQAASMRTTASCRRYGHASGLRRRSSIRRRTRRRESTVTAIPYSPHKIE